MMGYQNEDAFWNIGFEYYYHFIFSARSVIQNGTNLDITEMRWGHN